MAKETWSVEELRAVSGFLTALEESVQELEQEFEVKVTDLLATVQGLTPKLQPQWGIISMLNKEETTLQFEQGDFEIGPQ